jgi:hypothetical protein
MVTTIEETRCAEHGLRLCSMCAPNCGPVPSPPAGRALTPKQKRDAVERLLAAWQAKPDLRLGQLLVVACEHRTPPLPLFAVEDADLVAIVEAFAGRRA